ncbi:MAG: glycosyltransferase family 4 protein, partial [Phycisphaerae bacterium]
DLQPPLHLLLLGPERDAAYAAEMRAAAAAAGVGERVHFAGSVPDPERYYELVDIAVNARIDAEPYGLSVVEAMMMAKPVLAHALGGPAETVLDGVTGWLMNDASREAFKAGILRALDARQRWVEMGGAGRIRALERFSLDHQADEYLRLLQTRLKSRGRAPGAPAVAMVQDGPRLHYALPIALRRAGILTALYTDWYDKGGIGSFIARGLARVVDRRQSARMRLRWDPELVGVPIYHGGVAGLALIAARQRSSRLAGFLYRSLSRRVLRKLAASGPIARPAGATSVVFAFSHMFLPIPELNIELKKRGHLLLCDQPLVWAAEVLRQRKLIQGAFPGWEPTSAGDNLAEWAANEQALVPIIDAWTCPAEYTCHTLLEMGVPREKISVIPYPIDTSDFAFFDRRGRSGAVQVGFVGQVGLRKGAPWFLEAAKLCDPALVKFTMVGAVALTDFGRRQLEEHVELVGSVPRSQIVDWLKRFDIFFFPSTCEGSAGAVMEAMATGLPIIASPNSGSVVRDGVDGYIVDYDKPEVAAQRLMELARDKDLRLRMGHSAHERAMGFDIDFYSREIAGVISSVVARAGRCQGGA